MYIRGLQAEPHRTMPGLPTVPAGTGVDIDEDDRVFGRFLPVVT